MGTICASTLADLDLYSYEAYFMRGIFKQNKKIIVQPLNFTLHYINYVFSLNNSMVIFLDFYCVTSLKQQFVGRHVATLRHMGK